MQTTIRRTLFALLTCSVLFGAAGCYHRTVVSPGYYGGGPRVVRTSVGPVGLYRRTVVY